MIILRPQHILHWFSWLYAPGSGGRRRKRVAELCLPPRKVLDKFDCTKKSKLYAFTKVIYCYSLLRENYFSWYCEAKFLGKPD